MVNKQCVVCGNYFAGEWNGDYLCPDCRAAGASRLRPLSSLEGLNAARAPDPNHPRGGERNREGRAA